MKDELPYKEETFIINNIEVVVRGRFVDIEVELADTEPPEGIEEPENKDDW